MKAKEITGIVLITVGIGALSFLYFGYIKPRIEVSKELSSAQQTKKPTTKIAVNTHSKILNTLLRALIVSIDFVSFSKAKLVILITVNKSMKKLA